MPELVRSEVRDLIKGTNYWGPVKTDYGWMYLAGNDDGIALRYYHKKGYEPQTLSLWCSLCHEADWVIDVGAHTGIFTLAAHASRAKNILSIEPLWKNAARLLLNLGLNGYNSNGVRFLGAGDKDGIASIVEPKGTRLGYCTTASQLGSIEEGIPITVRKLDTLVPVGAKVSVVKLDVEQHTVEVLAGMTEILKARPDIIFEAFEDGLDDLLAPLGYHFYEIDERVGLSPVDRITVHLKDGKWDMDLRNRYATVKDL